MQEYFYEVQNARNSNISMKCRMQETGIFHRKFWMQETRIFPFVSVGCRKQEYFYEVQDAGNRNIS